MFIMIVGDLKENKYYYFLKEGKHCWCVEELRKENLGYYKILHVSVVGQNMPR